MSDLDRYAALAEDARYDRRALGEGVPDLAELEFIAERVDIANHNGTLHAMIDVQAEYIAALAVALHERVRQQG